jgi:hypothetical protein
MSTQKPTIIRDSVEDESTHELLRTLHQQKDEIDVWRRELASRTGMIPDSTADQLDDAIARVQSHIEEVLTREPFPKGGLTQKSAPALHSHLNRLPSLRSIWGFDGSATLDDQNHVIDMFSKFSQTVASIMQRLETDYE